MLEEERLNAITWFEHRADSTNMSGAKKMYRLAIEALKKHPTSENDIVHVVRCRDCRWNRTGCMEHNDFYGDDFCIRGMKRDVE